MANLLSNNAAAIKLLMNDELYLINENPKLSEDISIADNQSEPEKNKEASGKAVTDFNYSGENNKYFLVLVEDQIHTNLKAIDKELLLNILLAKTMDLRDIALVNIQTYPNATFIELKDFFACNRLLMLGIPSDKIGLPKMKINKVEKYNDVKVFISYSLSEMQNDKHKKREFWNTLKEF